MTIGRRLWTLSPLVLLIPGCAQSGSMLSQRTSVGTLKTGMSQLEFQNQQLRREVANLKADNRRVEDQLVQEESVNGELSARLDDARDLLGRRGVVSREAGSDPESARKTLPAGQSNRKRRKPPFARIPGQIEALPDTSDTSADDPEPGTPSRRPSDDLNLQSRRSRPPSWLPVATGVTESGSTRR